MRAVAKAVALATLAMVVVAGCKKQDEKKAEQAAPSQAQGPAKKESIVVVPDSVKGKWKAVKIAVTDKTANKESVYTVGIGSELAIPNSDLSIKVETFLPQFTMDGTTLTSQSNEPKNPAAQIRIMEGGKEVFKGWLFSLYPTTHAFNHPKYGFTLVDFIPAS
ncbi:DUF2155 domain-containing protein [Geobacter sp.]|uniref:DUF2155 domain-containing protein n=1 Tax=Geobacter sp. TaxID=46610 RepID=UPI002628531B|nr:DUF2155 domain-containing protein [Geobacter sp.]